MQRMIAAACLAALFGGTPALMAQKTAGWSGKPCTENHAGKPCDKKQPAGTVAECSKSTACEVSKKCFVCPACGEKGTTHGACPKCGTTMRCMMKECRYVCPKGCSSADKPGRCPKCRATLTKKESWTECSKPCAEKKTTAGKSCDDSAAPCDEKPSGAAKPCPATKKK